MQIGCSSLTMRLFCQQIVNDSSQVPIVFSKNPQEPDTNSIVHIIRRISELGLRSIGISIGSEAHLSALTEEDNAKKIKMVSEERNVYVDHIYLAFLNSWIFDAELHDLRSAWARIGKLSERIDTEIIEILSPPLLVNTDTIQNGVKGNPIEGFVTSLPWEKVSKRYIEFMEECANLAKENGLRLAVEPRPRELISNTDALLRLFDAVPSENLGAVVDISYMHITREIPSISIKKLGDKIFTVHLSDNDGFTERHWAPGQGQIDWLQVIKALKFFAHIKTLNIDVSGIGIEQEIKDGKNFIESLLGMEDRVAKPGLSITRNRSAG